MGPLKGLRILEFAGIGPGPFCGMVLADLGAEVVRIDRHGGTARRAARISPAAAGARSRSTSSRRRRSRRRCGWSRRADALIEGFRPGVMERLGLGPEACLGAQPAPRLRPHDRLGPGRAAGAVRRARHELHRADRRALGRSAAPANGRCRRSTSSATTAAAACCWRSACWRRCSSAKAHRPRPGGGCRHGRRRGAADGADLRHEGARALAATSAASTCSTARRPGTTPTTAPMAAGSSVGPIEPQFFALLLRDARPRRERFPDRMTPAAWPALKAELDRASSGPARGTTGRRCSRAPMPASRRCSTWRRRRRIRTTPRAAPSRSATAWCSPAPAPRFSRTPAELGSPPPLRGEHTEAVLADCGFSAAEIDALRGARAIA